MIKKSLMLVSTAVLILLNAGCSGPQIDYPKGNLIIIGGGSRPESVMDKFLELSGGPEAKILIIPNASSEPVETGIYYVEGEFQKYDIAAVDYLAPTRETVDNPESLAKLDGVTGVYFSGGDQSLLTDLMTGTKLLAKLQQMYRDGLTIGGTSAGAAIQSKVMITGNELINKDEDRYFHTIQAGNIETVPGFAFVDEAIIDQHHIMRKRNNRLISVVMENPQLLGIGIDEATAIWVKPDRTCEVIGESAVLLLNARNAEVTKTDEGRFHCRGMQFDILLNGDQFDLKNSGKI